MIDFGNSRRVMPRPLIVALRPRSSYNILQSRMAAKQDVEHHQISSNPCVNGRLDHGIILTNHSPGPAALQSPGTRYVEPCCFTELAQELPSISTQVTQSEGSPSELRVDVTGMCLDTDPMFPR